MSKVIDYGAESEYTGFTCVFSLPSTATDAEVESAIRQFMVADEYRQYVSIDWDCGDDEQGYYTVTDDRTWEQFDVAYHMHES